MAMGNGGIQFLRGSSTGIANNSTQTPAAGQPVYDLTNKRLYIGDGTTTLGNLTPLGTAGPTGATGATGAVGPTGATGATGASGVYEFYVHRLVLTYTNSSVEVGRVYMTVLNNDSTAITNASTLYGNINYQTYSTGYKVVSCNGVFNASMAVSSENYEFIIIGVVSGSITPSITYAYTNPQASLSGGISIGTATLTTSAWPVTVTDTVCVFA